MKDQILKIAEKLVEIESTSSNPEKLKEVVDFVDNYFLNEGFFIERYIKNSKHSIVITNTQEKKKTIILNGHLDVVDAEKHLFKLKYDGDRITGRGVFDMKAFAAMLMIAIENIQKSRPELSIALMLSTDEEIGGDDGMEYLIKEKGYSCNVAYIPDGGGHFNILTEEKGLLVLKITAYGNTAHAAYLWRGNNAIVKLLKIYNNLIDVFPLPQADGDWITSINLSKIEGGNTINKVPDKAEMYLDIRFPYPTSAESIVKRIEEIVSDEEVTIESIIDGKTFHSDPNNSYIKAYKEITERYLDREVNLAKAPGASDARFLSDKGIPVIITRCDGGGLHSPNEWISVPKLLQQYEILMNFLEIV